MAREVIFKTWCDPCLVQEQNVEAEELPPLNLLPGKPRVMALCEVHRKEVYDPLVEMLEEFGQFVDSAGVPTGPRGPYKKREPVPGGITCPKCGHNSPNRAALTDHARRRHDLSAKELLAETEDIRTVEVECPECGQMFKGPQGVGAHRAKKHGVPGLTKKAADAELQLDGR